MKNKNTLKQINLILWSALIVIVLMMIVFYFSVYKPLSKKNITYSQNILTQLEENINSVISNINQASKSISYNKSVQEYLVAKDMDRKVALFSIIDELLSSSKVINNDIVDISLFSNYDKKCSFLSVSDFNIHKEMLTIYDKYKNNEIPHEVIITLSSKPQNLKNAYYCYIKPIFEINPYVKSKLEIGAMFILCKTENIQNYMNDLKLSEKSRILVYDENEIIVLSNINNEIGTRYTGNDSLYRISGTNWNIVNNLSESEFLSDLRFIWYFLFVIWIIIILIIITINILITNRMLKPIKQIISAMVGIGKKGVSQRIDINIDSEIEIIVDGVNSMLERIETMTRSIFDTQKRLYELEILKNQSSLAALQSQINPHFLYNTLECTRSIAKKHHIDEIVDISTALADIFRYSIKENDYVSINQELEIVRKYLSIINIRFMGKIEIFINVQKDLYEKQIPKMILQPIVENAIYHGLEKVERKGKLTIDGYIENDYIVFKVIDNGRGVIKETLDELNKSFLTDIPNGKNNIGLNNVNSRLKLSFGSEYGLKVESEFEFGCTVTITLPN